MGRCSYKRNRRTINVTYERFAYVYDNLMQDAPYPLWVDFLERASKAYNIEGKKVLELACGTGELSILLAKKGYEVTGVDLSSDMLFVAQEKAQKENVQIYLFEQDMSELEGLGTFDLVTIFCDSLNYLTTPQEVQNTFKGIHSHLKNGGLLLFDVHSIYKMEEIFKNRTFAHVDEEIAYIWDCFPGEHKLSVEHELTFFIKDRQSEKYDRFEELHKQRTYTLDEYSMWLTEAGFSILEITADFSPHLPSKDSERIFFICQKNKK